MAERVACMDTTPTLTLTKAGADHSQGETRWRSRAAVVAAAAGLSLLLAPIAQAAITPTRSADRIARAVVQPGTQLRSASFVNLPPRGNPTAVSTSPLAGFPRNGSSYGILSTGSTRLVTRANDMPDTSTNNAGPVARGARDVVVLRIGINVRPSDGNCLSVGFRFLSEEFPEYTKSAFNDAFIAELDKHTWDANGTRSAKISAPDNFAFARQKTLISINGTGNFAVRPDRARGTTYDAGTRRLRASIPIKPGRHNVYLSIFDQGDRIYDSSVFIDNLRVTPRFRCVPGASLD